MRENAARPTHQRMNGRRVLMSLPMVLHVVASSAKSIYIARSPLQAYHLWSARAARRRGAARPPMARADAVGRGAACRPAAQGYSATGGLACRRALRRAARAAAQLTSPPIHLAPKKPISFRDARIIPRRTACAPARRWRLAASFAIFADARAKYGFSPSHK